MDLARLLHKMLQDLHAEQERLRGTATDWTGHLEALEAVVSQACTPRELERFRRFMTDLERVLGLLLLLGSRLARVHLALARAGPDSDPDERVREVEAGKSRFWRDLLSTAGVIPGAAVLTAPSPGVSRPRCCSDSGFCSDSKRTLRS